MFKLLLKLVLLWTVRESLSQSTFTCENSMSELATPYVEIDPAVTATGSLVMTSFDTAKYCKFIFKSGAFSINFTIVDMDAPSDELKIGTISYDYIYEVASFYGYEYYENNSYIATGGPTVVYMDASSYGGGWTIDFEATAYPGAGHMEGNLVYMDSLFSYSTSSWDPSSMTPSSLALTADSSTSVVLLGYSRSRGYAAAVSPPTGQLGVFNPLVIYSESNYDYLRIGNVDDQAYSGQLSNQGAVRKTGSTRIRWYADGSIQYYGFILRIDSIDGPLTSCTACASFEYGRCASSTGYCCKDAAANTYPVSLQCVTPETTRSDSCVADGKQGMRAFVKVYGVDTTTLTTTVADPTESGFTSLITTSSPIVESSVQSIESGITALAEDLADKTTATAFLVEVLGYLSITADFFLGADGATELGLDFDFGGVTTVGHELRAAVFIYNETWQGSFHGAWEAGSFTDLMGTPVTLGELVSNNTGCFAVKVYLHVTAIPAAAPRALGVNLVLKSGGNTVQNLNPRLSHYRDCPAATATKPSTDVNYMRLVASATRVETGNEDCFGQIFSTALRSKIVTDGLADKMPPDSVVSTTVRHVGTGANYLLTARVPLVTDGEQVSVFQNYVTTDITGANMQSIINAVGAPSCNTAANVWVTAFNIKTDGAVVKTAVPSSSATWPDSRTDGPATLRTSNPVFRLIDPQDLHDWMGSADTSASYFRFDAQEGKFLYSAPRMMNMMENNGFTLIARIRANMTFGEHGQPANFISIGSDYNTMTTENGAAGGPAGEWRTLAITYKQLTNTTYAQTGFQAIWDGNSAGLTPPNVEISCMIGRKNGLPNQRADADYSTSDTYKGDVRAFLLYDYPLDASARSVIVSYVDSLPVDEFRRSYATSRPTEAKAPRPGPFTALPFLATAVPWLQVLSSADLSNFMGEYKPPVNTDGLYFSDDPYTYTLPTPWLLSAAKPWNGHTSGGFTVMGKYSMGSWGSSRPLIQCSSTSYPGLFYFRLDGSLTYTAMENGGSSTGYYGNVYSYTSYSFALRVSYTFEASYIVTSYSLYINGFVEKQDSLYHYSSGSGPVDGKYEGDMFCSVGSALDLGVETGVQNYAGSIRGLLVFDSPLSDSDFNLIYGYVHNLPNNMS